jgi:Family of unknown function (DUF5691)
MQFWDNIINTAMMGTDKKQIGIDDIPTGLAEASALIHENGEKDKEEKFLQLATLAFNYRQCGVLPVQKEVIMPAAPAEEKEYCSTAAAQALNDIISEESIPLLKFWLQLCYERQQVIRPETVPTLLSTGTQQKKLQLLIAACCGKRGEWLAGFNPEWNFSSTQSDEELWQTGTFEQRKEVLKQKRKTDPSKARDWLQQTWPQEDANTKTTLLELLLENIGEDDISFLESLSTEKSKKVKEEAIKLLKQIPGSAIVQQYEQVLKDSVFLKKEKSLLGMVSKTVLQFKLSSSLNEAFYKTGIDKLSNNKEYTDDEFIIYQLMQSVSPAFWEKYLELEPAAIIDLFQKDATGKKMIPALVIAINRFRDTRWALYFMQHSNIFYIDIIPLLQAQQQEAYSNKFFDKFPDNIIQYAIQRETEWSAELTKNIFKHAAKNPYQYNRSFYNQYIHLIPVHIAADLERCTPPEENLRTMWSNTSEYIIKLITLKIQTIKAFNV